MYKNASSEQELLQSMGKFLYFGKKTEKLNKLVEAIDCLHAAAAVFDAAGLFKESQEITQIIDGLTK